MKLSRKLLVVLAVLAMMASMFSVCALTVSAAPDGGTDGLIYDESGKVVIAYTGSDEVVNIPEGVEEIGGCAFRNAPANDEEGPSNAHASLTTTDADGKTVPVEVNSGIKEVNLPSTLKKIGAFAFKGTLVERVTMYEGVTFIDNQAFHESTLKSITKNGETAIDGYAWLPDSLEKIGNFAVNGRGITTARVNPTLAPIDNDYNNIVSFGNCNNGYAAIARFDEGGTDNLNAWKALRTWVPFSYAIGDTFMGVTSDNPCNGTYIVPEMFTKIGQGAFSDDEGSSPNGSTKFWSKLTTVSLSSKTTEIGDYAFKDNDAEASLTTITYNGVDAVEGTAIFPETLTKLGQLATHATKIKNMTLPASLTDVQDASLGVIHSLETLTVLNPELDAAKNLGIPKWGPDNYENLAKIFGYTGSTAETCAANLGTGPATLVFEPLDGQFFFKKDADGNLTKIYGSTTGTKLTIPSDITAIPADVMVADSASVTDVIIPSSVTAVDENAFSALTGLKNVKGQKGSAAETYATAKGYTFIEMNPPLDPNAKIETDSGNADLIAAAKKAVADLKPTKATTADEIVAAVSAAVGKDYSISWVSDFNKSMAYTGIKNGDNVYYPSSDGLASGILRIADEMGNTFVSVSYTIPGEMLNVDYNTFAAEDVYFVMDGCLLSLEEGEYDCLRVPASVQEIDAYCFQSQAGLKMVDLMESKVSQILGSQFFGDVALETILYNDHVTYFGAGDYYSAGACMANCKALRFCRLPSQITMFTASMFWACNMSQPFIGPWIDILGTCTFGGQVEDHNDLEEPVIPSNITLVTDCGFGGSIKANRDFYLLNSKMKMYNWQNESNPIAGEPFGWWVQDAPVINLNAAKGSYAEKKYASGLRADVSYTEWDQTLAQAQTWAQEAINYIIAQYGVDAEFAMKTVTSRISDTCGFTAEWTTPFARADGKYSGVITLTAPNGLTLPVNVTGADNGMDVVKPGDDPTIVGDPETKDRFTFAADIGDQPEDECGMYAGVVSSLKILAGFKGMGAEEVDLATISSTDAYKALKVVDGKAHAYDIWGIDADGKKIEDSKFTSPVALYVPVAEDLSDSTVTVFLVAADGTITKVEDSASYTTGDEPNIEMMKFSVESMPVRVLLAEVPEDVGGGDNGDGDDNNNNNNNNGDNGDVNNDGDNGDNGDVNDDNGNGDNGDVDGDNGSGDNGDVDGDNGNGGSDTGATTPIAASVIALAAAAVVVFATKKRDH